MKTKSKKSKPLTGIDLLLSKTVKIDPILDKPSSFYLKPKQTGLKIGTTKGTLSAKVQSEEQVVKECTNYLRKEGWITKTLFTGGVPLGGGRYATNPAKGIPDTINFHPNKGQLLWIEYKKSHNGVVSNEQNEWHQLLGLCGNKVLVVNSLSKLKEYLNASITTTS